MLVSIKEKSTGKVVASVPVVLQGMNYTPSEQNYYDEAWRCAVEDKLVEPDLRNRYQFQLVQA